MSRRKPYQRMRLYTQVAPGGLRVAVGRLQQCGVIRRRRRRPHRGLRRRHAARAAVLRHAPPGAHSIPSHNLLDLWIRRAPKKKTPKKTEALKGVWPNPKP